MLYQDAIYNFLYPPLTMEQKLAFLGGTHSMNQRNQSMVRTWAAHPFFDQEILAELFNTCDRIAARPKATAENKDGEADESNLEPLPVSPLTGP